MEKIENNIKELHENLSNNYNKIIILITNTINNFEKQNTNDFNKEWKNIRRRQAIFEAIKI